MPGPTNAIIGEDANYGLDLPESQTDERAFAELQKTAKFSKTKEYQELKTYWDGRIAFYQTYLPDGTPVGASKLTDEELGRRWRSANVIIGEIEAQKNIYEQAAQAVKDEASRQKNA